MLERPNSWVVAPDVIILTFLMLPVVRQFQPNGRYSIAFLLSALSSSCQLYRFYFICLKPEIITVVILERFVSLSLYSHSFKKWYLQVGRSSKAQSL